jgi:hypothetical protein
LRIDQHGVLLALHEHGGDRENGGFSWIEDFQRQRGGGGTGGACGEGGGGQGVLDIFKWFVALID